MFLALTSFPLVHASTFLIGGGTSGTTSGETWAVNFDSGSIWGVDDWGMPGVEAGAETWSNAAVDAITLSFTLPGGVTISPSIVGSNCAPDNPCMYDFGTDQAWSASLGPGDLSITFFAPNGTFLNNGDSFYLDVPFTSTGALSGGLAFSGSAYVTPEPASVLMLGSGLLGLTLLARRRKMISRKGS
jgi:hypothetical protein